MLSRLTSGKTDSNRFVKAKNMADQQTLLSVGIDVGTTTTQVVFSRLGVANVARSTIIPRVEITDREVLYQSPIFITPLLDQETIDADSLYEMVRQEYLKANIQPHQVTTGAVIITGETAKKKNADAILSSLSGLAGDFIVSVAGPRLESMISGKGSGAAQYSRSHFATVSNVDIGGGSVNCAVFRSGNLLGSAAMNFGGRILLIDHTNGKLLHIAQPARYILQDLKLSLNVGDAPTLNELRRFCDRMAALMIELLEGGDSPLARQLYLTPPLTEAANDSVLMFSGGVGYYYYHPLTINTVSDVTAHDDVGPLFAESLLRNTALKAYTVVPPAETLRATVLGASTQTVSLSGSTIWAEREILPLKNIPVLHVSVSPTSTSASIAGSLSETIKRFDLNAAEDQYALALDLASALDYSALTRIAEGCVEFSAILPEDKPLVLIIERDYAQVLGQTVKGLMLERPLLVLDQIGLQEGDFIDIGTPLMDGRVVPISVKTLVFYN